MQKTKIEWADSTYNPITGCYHNCPYCYARKTADRFKGCFDSPDGTTEEHIIELQERLKITDGKGIERNAAYPYGFVPTLHRYRLNDLDKSGFGKTIFVGSMSDIFGDWVPDEWIVDIFNSCLRNMNHRYLFLTKNPERYLELAKKNILPMLDNFWYGTTVERPTDEFFYVEKPFISAHTFVSIEPILESFSFVTDPEICYPEWIIIGAETGSRKEKVVPEKDWIDPILKTAREKGIPVFMKDSLKTVYGEEILTEFPWED